ncbi:MAG: hypothetical protein ACP5JU_02730 [Minisyncoccia bacterium]
MAFGVLFLIFLIFVWFSWIEQKEGNTAWAIVFLIAGLAIFIMALVSR